MSIDAQLQSLVSGLLGELNTTVEHEIKNQLTKIDLRAIVETVVKQQIHAMIEVGGFPENSIPHSSIKFDGLRLSGNYIKGGIIQNFGSTGIEDLATRVQMTVMDNAIAFEGPVWAKGANIKGALTVDGDLIVTGEMTTDSNAFNKIVDHSADKVRTLLNDELFTGFSNIIYENLNKNGLDLDRITQNGKEVINGNQLGYHIIDTNIQRLGLVRDLQTQGENLLSDTLYVTDKRVGINTMDPSSALVVWDEEVEVVISKRQQDTSYIGSQRRQAVILGSNNKENIVLTADGTVEIESLSVGNVPMSSATATPNYEAITGTLVWNETPILGGPIGWVCLGGNRWAKFGKIE